MITDPWFYAAAIPAVLLFGISKGGFGGGLGMLAVPLMALVISPVQAAGILLPLLCIMDIVSVWKFRGKWIRPELVVLVPASLLGIGIGTLLFEFMSADAVRLVVGVVAVSFTIYYWLARDGGSASARTFPRSVGVAGGAVAGFTSFVAHAGGPPVNMYLLRRSLDRTEFVATTVFFFAVVNYVKLVPYAWLGQLSAGNLATSLVLAPLAPIGVLIGVYLHSRVSDRLFFGIVYVLLFLVGLRLIYDGLI
ncbi:MAG: sulfite exporter TauE/SafE family protein [Woeseiaceae bacterium]|nr:sulfite exporter TauE/SafE family protein [Woeseiaceae bacterium]